MIAQAASTVKGAARKVGGAARTFKLTTPIVVFLAVLAYAAAGSFTKGSTFLSVLAVGAAAAGAALFAGLLFGFLFGLPKGLEPAEAQPNPNARLRTNTNLDQISDWLTKILVGLGLVQLGKIGHGVSKIADALAPGLGGGSGAKSFGVAILIYSLVDGFLVGYIWTRIDLSERFRVAAEDLDPIDAALDQALQASQTLRPVGPPA